MGKTKEVTSLVELGSIDDECAPLKKCVCGATWLNWDGPILSIYADDPTECPMCGRKFYFRVGVTVYEEE